MRILHISADFPDPLVPAKTRAVENLLALVPEHEHRVWSLNRVGWRHGISALGFGAGHRALTYGAPPRGLRLAGRLADVAAFILEDADRAGFRPDLVHAHKLSVEGLAGETVAAALGVPLAISSQGDSDLKILGARPDLRPRWGRIWRGAAVALPFAPWTAEALGRRLGPRLGPTECLPCPTSTADVLPPRETGPLLRAAFHLGVHRRKNAALLMRAAAAAAREVRDLRLEIVGGGDAEAFATLSETARALDPGRIRLVGPRPHGEMPALFNAAAALAVPSRRESFGMVFVEALMAGCPVLMPRGFAIDGYLEDGLVSLAVPADDPAAVAGGLVRLAREETAFKRRLRALQENGGLALFRDEAIAATYRRALAAAVRGGPPAAGGSGGAAGDR